ncbi:hypothetical protein NKG05_04695 [Oerskovia sp. M15]
MSDQIVRLVTEHGLLDRIVAHNREVRPTSGWPSVLADVEKAYEKAAAYREERAGRGEGQGVGYGEI